MKLKLEESIEETLERLIKRTEKPSFDNNKGLTKIQQFIMLDTIEIIKSLGAGESIDEIVDE
jgi:hypothetical protein